jgi:hypothetical protein
MLFNGANIAEQIDVSRKRPDRHRPHRPEPRPRRYPGAGDGQPDRVVVNGTNGEDAIMSTETQGVV